MKILDIGAFDGSFLRALPSQFEKVAIEPSVASDVLAGFGIRRLKAFLTPPVGREAGYFDVVTMFDVFEHLTDPIGSMQAALDYVRPGGRLIVGTGNLDHWSMRWNRGRHWYFDPIQHLVFGSCRHFKWQAERLPATLVRCTKLSHQPGVLSECAHQSLVACYFAGKQGGAGASLAVRLAHRIGFFRDLAHKRDMPYCQQLRDHLLAEFVHDSDPC